MALKGQSLWPENLDVSVTSSCINLRFYFYSVTDRIEPVGNDIRAAEAGVDVPGATFIVEQPVETEVRLLSYSATANASSSSSVICYVELLIYGYFIWELSLLPYYCRSHSLIFGAVGPKAAPIHFLNPNEL